jgi:hypothetical protein
MTQREKIERIWAAVETLAGSDRSKFFESNNASITEFFVKKVLAKKKVDIGVFIYGECTGSSVSYRELKKEITLRLKKRSVYEIVLTLVNRENELHSFCYNLGAKDIKIIPENIRTMMSKVKTSGQPLYVVNSY